MIDEMKRQKRELVYKGSILDIYKDTMQFANGKTEEWDFVSHRKGAAAVLPVLDDGRIIMVRQYRNALERETIEIPAGCRDFASNCTVIRGVSFNAVFRISASFFDMENAGASFGPAISWALSASLSISA